mgnify:CR=1 FL=1
MSPFEESKKESEKSIADATVNTERRFCRVLPEIRMNIPPATYIPIIRRKAPSGRLYAGNILQYIYAAAMAIHANTVSCIIVSRRGAAAGTACSCTRSVVSLLFIFSLLCFVFENILYAAVERAAYGVKR